jgi:hypothetical protein
MIGLLEAVDEDLVCQLISLLSLACVLCLSGPGRGVLQHLRVLRVSLMS